MSTKRSDRLRSLISATVADAAVDIAPVTITGASMAAMQSMQQSSSPNSNDIELPKTQSSRRTSKATEEEAVANMPPAISNNEDEPIQKLALTEPSTVPEVERDATAVVDYPVPVLQSPRVLYQVHNRVKASTWQKMSSTLEDQDLKTLEISDTVARSYGVRLRKGGNPSLFIRAGLRLLEKLRLSDPDAWLDHILTTMPSDDIG